MITNAPRPIHFLERTVSEQLVISVVRDRVLLERRRRSASSLDDQDFHTDLRVALTAPEVRELRAALSLAVGQIDE